MFSTTCWDQHAQQEFRYEVWIARDPAPRGLEDPDAVWRLDDKAALGGLVAEYET